MQLQDNIGQSITTHEHFTYAPLESPQHIRLIELRPQNHDTKTKEKRPDPYEQKETSLLWVSSIPPRASGSTKDFLQEPIIASIVHMPLSSATGNFHAMSYRWDSTTNSPYTAIFSGQKIRISPTVHAMLRYCSTTTEILYIWIDALCINQADDKEKSIQVAMMFDIYSVAKEVIVWLGGEDDRLSTNSIQDNKGDEVESIVSQLAEISTSIQSPDAQTPDQNSLRLKPLNHASQSSRFKPLIKMLSHPWFERVWVIQEVVVAQRVKILYRRLIIDGDMFFNLMMRTALDLPLLLVDRTTKPQREPRGTMTSLFVRMARAAHQDEKAAMELKKTMDGSGEIGKYVEPPPDWFAALLGSSTLFISTDPRDQVYGLYGHCNPTQKPHLPPVDYTLSTREVYIKTARALLLETRDVYILMHAGLSKQSGPGLRSAKGELQLDGKSLGLPSWVPNWTFDPLVHMLGGMRPYVQVYDCAPGTELNVKAGKDIGSISVRGRIIDIVQHRARRFVAKPPTFTGTAEEERDMNLKNLAVFDEILDMAKIACHDGYITANVSPPNNQSKPDPSNTATPTSNSENPTQENPLTPPELTWRTLIANQYAFLSPAPPFLGDGFTSWYTSTQNRTKTKTTTDTKTNPDPTSSSSSELELETAYHTQWQKFCAFTRRVFLSRELGLMGLGPGEVEEGDVVAVFYGAPVPFILRRIPGSKGEEGKFEEGGVRYGIVGECFVYGLMDGVVGKLGLGEEGDILLV